MKRKVRIETAFEIARAFIYGERWRSNTAWCGRCESYVPLVTVPTAAKLDRTTDEEIVRRIVGGELHHPVMAGGARSICLSSLIDAGECSPTTETSFAHGMGNDNNANEQRRFVRIGPAAR